jgi:lipoprotein-anchoring transpeptidase ErfK/SrfK
LATHVSIGGWAGHTLRGFRNIDKHVPHKRSQKHDNAPMPYALHIAGGTEGYYLHQGRVNGKPLSHGCVRVPGLYQEIIYHLVPDGSPILLDENLYSSK